MLYTLQEMSVYPPYVLYIQLLYIMVKLAYVHTFLQCKEAASRQKIHSVCRTTYKLPQHKTNKII